MVSTTCAVWTAMQYSNLRIWNSFRSMTMKKKSLAVNTLLKVGHGPRVARLGSDRPLHATKRQPSEPGTLGCGGGFPHFVFAARRAATPLDRRHPGGRTAATLAASARQSF